MRDRLRRLWLRLVAYGALEPRFRSGRWRIRAEALPRLRPYWERQQAAYEKARRLFEEVNYCRECTLGCCSGAFNRFTVYDHVSHVVAGLTAAPPWSYCLHPFASYRCNRVDDGLCPFFVPGKGCGLPYEVRPATCVWWICARMQKEFDATRLRELAAIRRMIDEAHTGYARVLLIGGMERAPR